MYVDRDKTGRISLNLMTKEEAISLKRMIEGAGLIERQAFHHVLMELKKYIG